MLVPALVCLAFLILTAIVTLREWEIWPFTPYPMFSFYSDPRDVRVYCLDLEKKDGGKVRWRPEFPNYEEMLRGQIRAFLARDGTSDPRLRRALCKRLLAYIGMMGPISDFRRVTVISREPCFVAPSRFELRDSVIFSLSMEELIEEAIVHATA